MSAGPWYPRLSRDGAHYCGGVVDLWVDGAIVAQGRQPYWQDDDSILCAGPEVGVWRATLAQGVWTTAPLPGQGNAPVNRFSANGHGQWAYVTGAGGTAVVVTWDGRHFDGRFDVAVGPRGELAMVDDRRALTCWQPSGERMLIALGAQPGTLRWTEGGLTWTEYGAGPPRPWWWDGAQPRALAVTAPEWAVCAVRLDDDVWALTTSESALLLRPVGYEWGYRLPSMENGDGAWSPTRRQFRVVGTTSRGALVDVPVSPDDPAVDLRDGTVIVPPPPVTPPEGPNMPDSLFDSVVAERAKYANPPTADQCVELLNAVAYAHRDKGWGLSRKESGSHGVRRDGVPCALDILHHQPSNTLVDCLRDAGGASEPAWSEIGPPPSSDRIWVAPIAPADAPTPDPPPVTPPVTPSPNMPAWVRHVLGALGATLTALSKE